MTNNTDPVRALIAKWRRQAAEHGTRTFTGNDHAMFANELEAALASAPPSAPVGVEGLLADLETIWHSVSDDKETNAAYQRLKAALASAPPSAPEPEVHSYDPTDQRQSVTIRWQDGKCLSYVLDRTRYTDNLPQSAPVGVDGMVMVQASDLKTLAEFADRGMRGNPAKLAALRAKAILAAQQQGGA